MNQEPVRIFLLNKKVLFPHSNQTVIVRDTSFSSGLKTGDMIITYSMRNFFDLFLVKKRISSLAEITEITADKKIIRLHIKGICRVKIVSIRGFRKVFYEQVQSPPVKNDTVLCKELRKKAQELIFLINVEESDRLIALMNFLVDLNQISDFIANYFILDYKTRIDLLNETDITLRCNRLNSTIEALINNFKNQPQPEQP